MTIFANQATWDKGCFDSNRRLFEFFYTVFEGTEVVPTVNDGSRSDLVKSKSPVYSGIPTTKDGHLLSFILLDVRNMIVNIVKVLSPINIKRAWFKGPATHGNNHSFRVMQLARSSDGEEVAFFSNILYSFIEKDRCIKPFDLLNQAVAQFFTSQIGKARYIEDTLFWIENSWLPSQLR